MPTLKDIALKTGYSISTVSRALNGSPNVNNETREEVQEVARQLGYSVNVVAQGLVTARTKNIAFLEYWRPDYLLPDQSTGGSPSIQRVLNERGYHLLSLRVDKDMMSAKVHLQMVQEKRVDGFIIVGPEFDSRHIMQLYNTSIPVVLYDNKLENGLVDCVNSSNHQGMYEATRHLIVDHHHEHLVFLSGPVDWLSSRERYAGYQQAMEEAGLTPIRAVMPETTIETGENIMKQVLVEHPEVTGVVGVNDATVWGASRACRSAGKVIPDDIALVGFDDAGWARLHEPPLTTVNRYQNEMDIQAAKRILELLDRDAPTCIDLRIKTSLIVRESCGCKPA